MMTIADCACLLVIDTKMGGSTEDDQNTDGVFRSVGIWQFGLSPVSLYGGDLKYGMIDQTGRLVLDYEYDSVSEAGLTEYPAGGPMPPLFLGVHCRKGDLHIYYRICPGMKLVEKARMTGSEYQDRCSWT